MKKELESSPVYKSRPYITPPVDTRMASHDSWVSNDVDGFENDTPLSEEKHQEKHFSPKGTSAKKLIVIRPEEIDDPTPMPEQNHRYQRNRCEGHSTMFVLIVSTLSVMVGVVFTIIYSRPSVHSRPPVYAQPPMYTHPPGYAEYPNGYFRGRSNTQPSHSAGAKSEKSTIKKLMDFV